VGVQITTTYLKHRARPKYAPRGRRAPRPPAPPPRAPAPAARRGSAATGLGPKLRRMVWVPVRSAGWSEGSQGLAADLGLVARTWGWGSGRAPGRAASLRRHLCSAGMRRSGVGRRRRGSRPSRGSTPPAGPPRGSPAAARWAVPARCLRGCDKCAPGSGPQLEAGPRAAVRLELSGPLSESLTGKLESCSRERPWWLQIHGTARRCAAKRPRGDPGRGSAPPRARRRAGACQILARNLAGFWPFQPAPAAGWNPAGRRAAPPAILAPESGQRPAPESGRQNPAAACDPGQKPAGRRAAPPAPAGCVRARLKPEIHRIDPEFGSTLTISNRDSQSNCWVNLRILGQPCEF
jgi:hypothetical protein